MKQNKRLSCNISKIFTISITIIIILMIYAIITNLQSNTFIDYTIFFIVCSFFIILNIFLLSKKLFLEDNNLVVKNIFKKSMIDLKEINLIKLSNNFFLKKIVYPITIHYGAKKKKIILYNLWNIKKIELLSKLIKKERDGFNIIDLV